MKINANPLSWEGAHSFLAVTGIGVLALLQGP